MNCPATSCEVSKCQRVTRIATSPVSAFFRYFGTHTRCTFKSVFV